jgi:hypothetical protein
MVYVSRDHRCSRIPNCAGMRSWVLLRSAAHGRALEVTDVANRVDRGTCPDVPGGVVVEMTYKDQQVLEEKSATLDVIIALSLENKRLEVVAHVDSLRAKLTSEQNTELTRERDALLEENDKLRREIASNEELINALNDNLALLQAQQTKADL